MNTRGICLECAGREQHAPGYAVTRKTEQDVVLRIDENFKGVGTLMRAGHNRQVASKKALLTFLLAVCLCLCGCAHYGKPCCREYKVFCGMSSPEGEVSEADWRRFCDTHVTAAFPDGYTSFEGTGYWRNHGDITMRENTRVLLIVAPVDAKEKVLRLARQYCEMFHQEAVLVVTSNIDAAFVEVKK